MATIFVISAHISLRTAKMLCKSYLNAPVGILLYLSFIFRDDRLINSDCLGEVTIQICSNIPSFRNMFVQTQQKRIITTNNQANILLGDQSGRNIPTHFLPAR